MSIRLRLTLTYTLLLLITLVAFGAILYLLMRQNLQQEMDRRLRIRAQQVTSTMWPLPSSLTTFSLKAARLDLSPLAELSSQPLYVQVLDPEGEVLATSENLRGSNLPVRPEELEETYAQGQTVADYRIGDGSIRMFSSVIRGADDRIVGVLQVGQSRAGLEDPLETLGLRLLLLGVFALASAGLAGWILGQKGLRPLAAIASRAKTFAEERNFSARLNVVGPADEVTRLAATIDNLLQTVEETLDSHRQFLADTSHELRNPIFAARTNLDLLDRVSSPEERAECIREAMGQIERLSTLVNELLLLARFEEGLVLDRQPVSLTQILSAVVVSARRTGPGRRIVLETSREDAVVNGDGERLHQIFANLIDNAIRYTESEGLITISLERSEAMAKIRVQDDGTGIGPEHLPRVFERFYRVDGKRGGGTGLGLAIVKHLVELHGGTISVESTLGRGSCFTILLPVSAAMSTVSPSAELQIQSLQT